MNKSYQIKISRWSYQNKNLAATIVTILSIYICLNGLYIGQHAFGIIPYSITNLLFGILVLLFLSRDFLIEKFIEYSNNRKKVIFQNTYNYIFCLLLTICIGMQQNFHQPKTIQFINTSDAIAIYQDSTTIKKNQKEINIDKLKQQNKSEKNIYIHKWVYVVLFILCLFLCYNIPFIACSLACSGEVVAAVLIILLGFDILASGIFFIVNAIRRKKIKKWKFLNKEEQKKTINSYLLYLLIGLISGFVFLISLNW